jgi:antitoxin ParD1/3/4
MEISLTPEQVSFLDRQVKSGRFASAEDAISEAVSLLEQREADDLCGRSLDELRAEIQLGIDQLDRGEGIEVNEGNLRSFVEAIGKRGRARLAERSSLNLVK